MIAWSGSDYGQQQMVAIESQIDVGNREDAANHQPWQIAINAGDR
jgi:hypothetical protein